MRFYNCRHIFHFHFFSFLKTLILNINWYGLQIAYSPTGYRNYFWLVSSPFFLILSLLQLFYITFFISLSCSSDPPGTSIVSLTPMLSADATFSVDSVVILDLLHRWSRGGCDQSSILWVWSSALLFFGFLMRYICSRII